jgi:hypothetical protein
MLYLGVNNKNVAIGGCGGGGRDIPTPFRMAIDYGTFTH